MTGEALTEEEALKLYRGWGNLRPEQLPRAKERLRGYMQARQLAGEPLWPQMEANWNRAQMEREESLWLNEDTDLSVRQIDFMAGVTGRSPFDIASEPNRYRQAVAAYLGSAKDGETPEAFDALVKSHVTRRRDARLLKWGNGKDDEASEAENQLSMARFAGEAARIGKDSIQAFQEWQRAVSGKPGYAALQSEGEGLYTEFQQRHAEASDYWRDLERRADAIIGELSAETENDSPFVIGNTALPHLDGLTRPQRQMVMALVTERAKGKDKGFAKQSVEALGRVFSRLTEATGDSLSRQALDALAFKEGDEVAKSLAGNPKKLVTRRASASVAAAGAGMLGDTSGMAGVDPEELFGDTVNLTKEQAAAANAEVSRRRESLAVVGDLRDAARGAVDPVRGSNFVTKWAWYPFLNVTGSLASFIMPGGWAANVGAYVNEEQNRLESLGVDRSTAAAQAVTVGSAQALMDKLQLKFLGRMTALRGVTSKLAAPAASTAGFFGRRVPAAVGTAAVQTGIEAGQEALPLAVQKTLDALGVDEPDVSWSDIGSEAWAATEESFFGMLPLMLLGAGVGARRDFKSMQSLVSDRGALQAMGFDEAATERIAGAGNEDAMVAALQREWPGRTPIYTAPASPGEAQADAVLQNEAAPVSARTGAAQFKAEIEEARAFSARMNSVLMEEAGIRAVRRSDAGWTVHGEDGSSVTLESPGEVSAALLQMAHARDRESAQEIIAEVDALTAANVKRGEGTEVSFTGETRKATLEGDTLTVTKVKQGKPSPLDVSPESLATLHGEMKALGLTDAVIRGSNWLKEDAGKIVRHYELNLGSDVSTVVHERVESLFKSGVAAPAEVWAAANQLAALPQFDPAKLKDDGQRRMAESLRRIALEDDSVTEDERRETLVELAVADYLGRWKDGTTFAPGSLRDAVRRAEAGAKGATRRALEAFSRWLAMVGRYFGALFGTVKAIREARASGELKPGEAWDTMMNKLLGLDVQAEHEAAVAEGVRESFALAGPRANLPQFQRDSLSAAQAMAAAGKSSEEIRALTGWFPGKYDGKLRWEIPDEGARLKARYEAADLEKAQRAQAVIDDLNQRGIYDSPERDAATDELKSFRANANISETGRTAARGFSKLLKEGDDSAIVVAGVRGGKLSSVLHHPQLFAAYPDAANIMVGTLGEGPIKGSFSGKTISVNWQASPDEMLSTLLHEIQHWIQRKEGFAKGSSTNAIMLKAETRDAFGVELEKLPDDATKEQVDDLRKRIYQRVAGEIEARDVQARQGFTPEQRAAIAPYSSENIAPEDAIVMMGQGAESFSLGSNVSQKESPGELSPAGALDEALVLGLHPQANMFQSAPVSGRLPDFSGGSLLDESQLSSRTFSLSRARDGVSEAVSEVRRVEAEESDARRQWGLEHGRSYEAASFAGERIPLRVGWSEQSGRWAANIAGGVFRNQEIVYNRYWSAYDVDRVLMDGHEISRRPGADHMDFAPFPESSELAKARARLVEAEVDLFLAEEEDGGREQRMADKESAGQWARRTKAAQFAALLEARDAEHEKQARGFVSSVWTAFARNDEIFQFGRTRSKNAARIAEAVSAPGRPVSATDTGQSIVFSGKEGALAIYDADTSRPYIRSTGANSQGKKEGGGSQLYAAALDWIHNNKKRIKDDSGLTDINAVRRTSNFLASALRWGTTRHLKPHAKQGVPWTNEETLNLSALAAKEMQNAFSAIAEARGWSYDFQSGKFRDNAGNDITRDGFESAVRLGNPSKSGIGLSTLQRAVITHSAIRAFERGETANDVLETEIGGVVPPGVTYSLGSVGVLEQIAAAQEARAAARGPKAKLEMHADMARTLSGMARAARMNEETERVLALGEIETERRALQQRLKDEYTLEVYRGPVGAALGEEENAEIKSHPFLAKIIEPGPHGLVQGRFLSPEKAKKAGMDLEGEYDGAREWGLPGWLFKGVMEPDLMAKELGIERVDDMWSEIASSLESLNKAKKRLRKAQEQLAEAKIRAREDARTWAGMERAKLAESDKRDAKRALVALDAMMLHAPAEVRVKVGGFARMNELTTNKAREAYFKDRLEALDREMEAYLRRQYLKETRELFHKSRARRVSGEKDKGRLGTNAHTWIETAEAISKLSAQKLSEREAWVNARLFPQKEEDRLTEDEIKELNRAWDLGTGEDAALLALEQEQAILELFGRLDKKDSAELESALTALRETADRGRAQWDATLRDRRERRAGRRAGLKIDSGNEGSAAERAEKAKELRGMKGRKDAFFNLGASMEQLIGDFFGRESDTHMWAEETILNARLTAEAAFIDSQRRMSELLKRLWPRSKGWQRAKHLEKLATEKPVAGAPDGTPELSELQAIHMTMLWSDWESWQWLRDHGFGEETQEKLEAHLSPEAREIRAFLVEEYDRQYDRLNDVYRRLHGVNMPRVRNYAPRMVLHGGDTVTLDPLAGGSMSSRGVFAGFTKRRRPDLTAAPVLADALQAFMQNQKVVTHFLGWAEASGDLRAVFSTSETKPFIVAAAGDQGARSLHERLTDLEAGGFKEALAMGYWKGFMRALADNALVGKIGPFLKQASAVYGSAVELGWGPYLRSAGRLMRGEAAATVEQVAALPIMKTRLHNLSQETMQAASGTGPAWMTRQLRRAGFDTAFVDAGMIWMRNRLGVLDAVLTLRGAAIAYDSHWLDAKEQKMSDAAAHDYAARETQRTIARTAQPASVADRSHYENRAGTFGRLMFAFQSMNRQMFFATWAALRDGGIKDARARRMLGTWWVLTGIITQAIGAGVRDMFSDDDEDEDWKLGDFLRAATLGPLTGALYLGPLVDVASSWLGGFERRTEVSPAGAVSDFTKEAIEALKADEELEAKEVEKIARSAGLFGQAAGGGWWSSLNVLANLWKQGSGLADNLFTSEEEALEADAARQRKADKEARDAAADALTDEQKEAARKEREANRRKRLEREAERWRARQ